MAPGNPARPSPPHPREAGSARSAPGTRGRRRAGAAVLFLCAAVCAALYFLDPAAHVLMPKCAIRLLTGLSCPGCGLQRATHALLHGHVGEAVRYNLFLVVSVPYALALAAAEWGPAALRSDRLRRMLYDRRLIYAYAALALLWCAVRNVLDI